VTGAGSLKIQSVIRLRRSLPAFLFPLILLMQPLGASGDLIKWRSVAQGEKEARASGKPVLYFFTADWCGPCHILKNTVFSDPKAADLVRRNYVPVVVEDRSRVEGIESDDMLRLAKRFRVRGFPTLVVSRPEGKKGVTVEGFPGKETSMSFLADAGKRLKQLETEAGKPAGGTP
jgi:thiol:disulfide interchange protein